MTDKFCSGCGTALEPMAGFCANCGLAIGAEHSGMGTGAPPAQPPQGIPGPMAMMYPRPPKNPRQRASSAAAVMILIAGIFSLIWGNIILYEDAFPTRWDETTGEDARFIDLGPFISGMAFVIAFAISLLSAYCAFRLIKYEAAVAGPVTLLIGYFATLAYETFLLVIAVEILILAIVSLGLLYYAIPIYSGRNAPGSHFGPGGLLPMTDIGQPAEETMDKYPEGPSTKR